MDPPNFTSGSDSDARISRLVDDYFNRRQAGEQVTPESFIAEHPEVAEQLRPYLAGIPLIENAISTHDESIGERMPAVSGKLPLIEGYELLEEIGRGGMGVVYKALQKSTKRVVALKVLLAGPFASANALRRFEREVELAARFKHAGIVRLLESGEMGQQHYYAMDYVEGVRLDRYISQVGLKSREILELFQKICDAVEYAHQHGVVHRDLKPGNILIDEAGNPHVLDFGLAKATDQTDSNGGESTCVSLPGQVLGTLFYLSPEQATGQVHEIDGRTDVYALGVMLFETLTGSLPFDTTGRPSQVIQRILDTAPTRPTTLSSQVDGEIETIILKALAKEREQRYQSALELGEDIRRYLAGEPILARRPSSLYVLRKKIRKHRLPVSTVALALLIVVISLIGRSWTKQRVYEQTRRETLECQRAFEFEGADRLLGVAQALYERGDSPPEVLLVWAQAQYRAEATRSQGISFLDRYVRHNPENWAAKALLAEINRAGGDIERADDLQIEVDLLAPDTAEAWYLRSFTTFDRQQALNYAQQAVNQEPTHKLAWNRLTWLRHLLNDPEGAYGGAERLIELGEDPGMWTIFKGCVRARQGLFQEAIEEFSHVDELTGENGVAGAAQLYRAHCYLCLKDYGKAVEEYTGVIDRAGSDRADVWHYYQRATPLWILGRTDEALADYRRVRTLLGRPYYSDVRSYIILRGLGRDEEAQQIWDDATSDTDDTWLRRILRCLAGKFPPERLVAGPEGRDNPEQLCEAYYYGGEACLLLDQLPDARQWFEKCIETGIQFDPDITQAVPMNEYALAQWRLASLPTTQPTTQPVSQP